MKIQKIIIGYLRARIRLLSTISKKLAAEDAVKIFCTPYSRVKYNIAAITNAEQLTYNFNGLTTYGYRRNKGGTKKILIAHGFRSSSANFEHFSERLSIKGYEVVAFDAPAHGRSEGKILTAIDYKNFIAAIHKHFGPFEGFLTHSFGGLSVSLNLVEMPNENMRTVLIAPAANSKTLVELFFKEMYIKDKVVQAYFFETIKNLGGHPIEWFSINRCAEHIKGEVLWAQDLYDKVTPVDDAILQQEKNQGNFHFIFTKNLGHRRIYRDEKVMDAVVDFL